MRNDFESNYLVHHGILGQKWGVRRYQNADGTLTEAGKKHYAQKADKMSDEKLHKTLVKQIHNARQAKNGGHWYNRFMSGDEIGPESKAMREQYKKDFKEWENSPEVKKWSQKFDRLDKLYTEGKMDDNEYEQKSKELWSQRPEKQYRDLGWAYISGKGYYGEYIKKGGKDLSIARLKDLGYDEATAKKFVNRLIKSGLTLGGKE